VNNIAAIRGHGTAQSGPQSNISVNVYVTVNNNDKSEKWALSKFH